MDKGELGWKFDYACKHTCCLEQNACLCWFKT